MGLVDHPQSEDSYQPKGGGISKIGKKDEKNGDPKKYFSHFFALDQ